MSALAIGVVQFPCTDDAEANIAVAVRLIRDAAAAGARVILTPELFAGHYFCQEQHPRHFDRAEPAAASRPVAALRALAAELGVVLPVSFFERAGPVCYNTVAMVDAGGAVLGLYRKSHIPDGPGYSEKYYFRPGDTGFRVWDTAAGRIGVGICWDQWFPEAARAMALMGAEAILYPTAIGTEPLDPAWDSMPHWRRVMQGHAAANMVPVAAANRTGTETVGGHVQTYYGSSFIADATGGLVAEAGREGEAVLVASFDRAELAARRTAWGLFRDRRTDLYDPLVR
jgi:N-carbamoylputrescine amidase